jgi:hypothetical protein
MGAARAAIEVTAGIIADEPLADHTRRWVISAEEWEQVQQDGKGGELLAVVNGQALGYASLLMLQPDRFNWVHADWIWF